MAVTYTILSKMPKVSIPQKNMTLEAESGTVLMTLLMTSGLPVASSCHGEGICSMCKVKVEGDLTPPEDFEIQTLQRNKCEPEERLSCQIVITSDLTVSTKYW